MQWGIKEFQGFIRDSMQAELKHVEQTYTKLIFQTNDLILELAGHMQNCATKGDQICDEAKAVELELKLISNEIDVLKQVISFLHSFLYKPN